MPERSKTPPQEPQPASPGERHGAGGDGVRRGGRKPLAEGFGGLVSSLAALRDRHGLPVLPSVRPGPAPSGPEITVASYNVHKCVGTDRRFDPARIAQVIGEIAPDILAVQEADRRFGRRTGLLDMVALQGSGLHMVQVSRLPDGHGWHGNALLVRRGTPMEVHRLTLPGAEPRGAVMVEMELPGGRLRVVAAHFGLLKRCRMRQSATILDAIGRGPTMPTLMLGDLNEWRPGRRSSLRPLEMMFGGVSFGPPSFPSRLPVFALDRILGWPQGLVREVQAHDSPLARIASDHLPLKARLSLARVAAEEAGMAEAAA